jgi:hypothetical protein
MGPGALFTVRFPLTQVDAAQPVPSESVVVPVPAPRAAGWSDS